MVGHGRPDYRDISPLVQVHASDDLNELAARTHNTNVYDRRGNVVHTETFGEGLGAAYLIAGGTASYYLSGAHSRSEGLALLASHNGDAGDTIVGTWSQGVLASLSRGLEISWSHTANKGIIQIIADRYDGALRSIGHVGYDFALQTPFYIDSAGDKIELEDTWPLVSGANTWHFMKMALDYETGKYLRIMLDGKVWSLSAFDLLTSVSAVAPYETWKLSITGGGAVASDFYVDSLIVTINEL